MPDYLANVIVWIMVPAAWIVLLSYVGAKIWEAL